MYQLRILQNRRLWDGVKHRNEICGIHWEKGQIKHTHMEGKQCYYLQPDCAISTKLLLSLLEATVYVLLVRVHKYGQARRQGSKSVALCFGFYGAQLRLHMIF